MTRFPGPPDFQCAICERHVDNHFPGSIQHWSLPPVCRYCECHWGQRPVQYGAFRDRRVLAQIGALAEALNGTANIQLWEASHGRA